MSKINLDYIAGFFDGEGCISITKRAQRKENRSPEYKPVVVVSNINREVLIFFKELFGGYVYLDRRPKSVKIRPNQRPLYRWVIMNTGAYNFCKKMKDKLFLKRKNAEVLIEFYDSGKYLSKVNKVNELKRRNELYLKIRELNKRGIF